MLSATQIYTIFTVQLFAFLNLLPVEADIAAYSFDNKTENFDDLPARFGYRLPSDGLKSLQKLLEMGLRQEAKERERERERKMKDQTKTLTH